MPPDCDSFVRIGLFSSLFGWIALGCIDGLAATLVVDCNHVNASDENPGTEAAPLRTIQQAAQRAQPGDTVLVHGGVYRERVAPARGGTESEPILYTAASGESVVIKGSEPWQPSWTRVDPQRSIFAGKLDASLFANENSHPYRTRLRGMPPEKRLTLGQVFVDGEPFREVDQESDLLATAATWMANAAGDQLMVHFPPGSEPIEQRRVEVSVRQRIFAPYQRGLGYLHVRGFTMEHCANQFPEEFWKSQTPQAGALGCRAGHHWVIEGNTIRFAKSIGLDCGYEGPHDLEGNQPTPQNTGYHRIRNNRVTDNGCCGIAGMRSHGTQIVGNLVERNNRNRHHAPEIAGIKLHHFFDGLISGNLVRDNEAYGIWLDNLYRGSRVTQNVVIGNRGSGIFVELGQGPVLVDRNVLGETRAELHGKDPRADGLCTHDASGVLFAHNLVFGCQRFGASMRKMTNRPAAGASRITLRNNLFIDNQQGHLEMPYPGPDAQDNWVDHNLYSPGGLFLVNPWGGVSAPTVLRAVEAVIGSRPTLRNRVSPQLSLEQWRKVSVWGVENREASVANASLSDDLVLTLGVDKSIRQINAYPVDQVTTDFFGNAIVKENSRLGPFQRITAGENRLSLSLSLTTPISDRRSADGRFEREP